MIRILFSLVAIALVATVTARADAQPVSRADAVEAALEFNPRLGQAEARVRGARLDLARTRSDFLPRVTVSASGGVSDRRARTEDGLTFDEQASPTTASLDLNHTLYASGQRTIGAQLAQLSVRQAQLEASQIRSDLIAETLLVYDQAVFAGRRLEVEIEAVAAIAEQLEGARARLARGAASRTDVAQAEARLAEAQARVSTAQADRAIALATLEALTGVPAMAVERERSAPASDLPERLDQAIGDAIEFNPTLRALQLAEREARLGAALAGRRYGPTLAFNARVQRVSDPSPVLDRDDEARAVINFSMPLYSGGARSAEIRAGLARRDEARLAALEFQTSLAADVRTQWALNSAAEAALAAQVRRVSAAREALQGVTQGQEAGLSSTLEVLDEVRGLQLARLARLEAERGVREARIRLKATTGRLES